MKALLLLAFCAALALLPALSIPVSQEPVLREDNLLTGLLRVSPDDQAPEQLITQCWLWQDGNFLVAHFECEIDSTFKTGTITTRDSAPDADYVRLQLITVPEAFYAYFFYAYPLGNLFDGVRSDTSADIKWNSGYSYESRYDMSRWIVTMRIPLTDLRFKQQLPYRWKVIITRNNKKVNESYNLPYLTTSMRNDYYAKALDIELSQAVRHRPELTIKPYYVKSYDLVNKTTSYDPDHLGMDLALKLGQRTRGKISLNPDFSDVPPDNAADNYNSKYPPYFAENRFFFTEDIDAYGVGSSSFYTRNIAQPSFAFKLNGTTGALNWGILGARDKQITDSGAVINPDDYYQVLALIPTWKKLRLSNSLITRTNKGYYNHVYKGSYRWNLIKDFVLTTDLMGSVRRDEQADDPDPQYGYVSAVQLNAFPGNWIGLAAFSNISRDFAADAGYYWDTDLQSSNLSWGYATDTGKGYVKYQEGSLWGNYTSYLGKERNAKSIGADYYASFRPDYEFSLNGEIGSYLDLNDQNHDTWNLYTRLCYYHWSSLQFYGTYSHYKTIVYSLYDTYDLDRIGLGIWGEPAKTLSYSLYGTWNSYSYPRVNTVVIDTLQFTVNLDNRYAVVNGVLTFTPNAKLRLSSGLGLSTYESAVSHADLTYYASLRYEFRPEYFLFAGYSTRQNQDIASSYSDPLGHFTRRSASLYAKVALTFQL